MTARLATILILLAATVPAAQSSRAPQIESITAAQLRADLFFLASDAMQGRLTDTRENAIAADWVQSRLDRLGLKPGGQGGSFDHRYFLMKASLGSGTRSSIGGRDDSNRSQLTLGEQFYPHRFSANGSVQARLSFAGFGIVSRELGHDDYRDQVANQIVLILDREPGVNDPASKFDGVVTAEAAQPLRKVLAAQEKGAVGVIFVEDVHNQTGTVQLPGAGRQLLAGDAAADRALHPQDLVGSGAHPGRAGVARGGRTTRGAEREVAAGSRAQRRDGRRRHAGPHCDNGVDDDERRSPHGARSQHRRHARRQRPDAQERVRPRQRALRS